MSIISNNYQTVRRTAAVHNLGCKVNAYESEAMERMLQEAGYELVPFSEKADVYIVNTCTVTNTADRKSRQMLHRARHINPDALIVAVGCYVQTHVEQVLADQDIDLAIGTNEKSKLIGLIEARLGEDQTGKQQVRASVSDISRRADYEMLPEHLPQERCRAFLKIQDGCDQFCSYCAIPLARGRIRSREPEDIVKETEMLAAAGFKEIVLTGIHLCSYGRGLAKEAAASKSGDDMAVLLQLIRRLADLKGISRIRLGSLEPGSMTEEVIRGLSFIPKVCPHFHLSLQSGCDVTLARMNRHYTTDQFAHVCDLLRLYYDEPTLTTDVIVGFPGESEEEFEQTCSFLERIRFYHTHLFKYSRRDGTRAAVMPDQVPESLKTERSRRLENLNRHMKEFYRKQLEGKRAEVLIEENEDGMWIGHTAGYLKAQVNSPEAAYNELFTGIIGKEIRIID